MSNENIPFMIRSLPQNFQKINTGCHVKFSDGVSKVTQIHSVRVTPTGQIEVVGRCKSVKGVESNQ